MSLLKNYELKLFDYFEEICSIPHQSAFESEIADYLVNFAKSHSLEYHRDDLHNVIIKKSGSKGKENMTPIILQGHTDMVCEKNDGTEHDFLKDGLKLQVKDDILTAVGTTLGADNGVAVALMMAVLDDDSLSIPPLECVFTSQEEIGLIGANNLDFSKISGKTLINLDSEEEGVATVSCAAGMRIRLKKNIVWENKKDDNGLLIQVRGLAGGHSGMSIGTGVANANKLLGRFLYELGQNDIEFNLCSIGGGNKDNAIPREAEALISLASSKLETAQTVLNNVANDVKKDLVKADSDFNLIVSKSPIEKIMSKADTDDIIDMLVSSPNGVLKETSEYVIASNNLGILSLNHDTLKVVFSPRSSVAELQEDIKKKFHELSKVWNFDIKIDSEYPGWEYAETSKIRDTFIDCYKKETGNDLKIEAIHAGLECGIFAKNIEGLDAIAVGPNIQGCHTPQECLDLKSFERFYNLLLSVLTNIS